MTTNISMLEFYKLLEQHDWFHNYSDSYSVCVEGQREESKLKSVAAESPERKALFDTYHSYIWKGTEKPSKPLF